MKFIKGCLLLSVFLFSNETNVTAQQVSKTELRLAIDKIAELIDNHYVFPSKGKAIATGLAQRYKAGNFNTVGTWKEFDSLCSKTLRELSGDGHLYVRYDPKMVKELSVPADTSQKGPMEDPFFYGPDAPRNNYGFREVKVLDGNIGYIRLSEINISEKSLPVLYAAMEFVANTRALVIDLKNNGGGGNAIGNVLESFFLPKDTPLLQFRSRNGASSIAKTVPWLTQKKYNRPLFLLVNKHTFSAAEALAYSLQYLKRAMVVGQPSGGGAHMNSWYPVNEHIFLSVSTGAPVIPGTETSWEGKGVQPDYPTEEGAEIEVVRKQMASNNK